MSSDSSSEETVFAIYSTRAAAERARAHLQEEDIEAVVRTDDTSDEVPHHRRPHGAELAGPSSAAQDAYEALNEAELLPDPVDESEGQPSATETADSTSFLSGTAGLLGVVVVVGILLYLLLT